MKNNTYLSILNIFNKIEDENYVVIRNCDQLEKEYVSEIEDIDLLCENNVTIVKKLGLKVRNSTDTQIHYVYVDGDAHIKIDLWNSKTGYFDSKWCNDIFATKVTRNNYFVPTQKNAFYMLLYHVLVQKENLPQKYKTLILKTASELDISISYERKSLIRCLELFMRENGYQYKYNTYPLAVVNLEDVSSDLIDYNTRLVFNAKIATLINLFKAQIIKLFNI